VVELSDENPITARKLLEVLPVEGKANLWGDGIAVVKFYYTGIL